MFNLDVMALDDERLPYLNFKEIKLAHKEHSLSYPVKHNKNSILEIRHLGRSTHQVDWAHLEGKNHRVFGFISNGYWVTGGQNGVLYVYDTNGVKIASLAGHKTAITSLATDKKSLVSSDDSGLILLWDLNEITRGKKKILPLLYMVYAADGNWLISSTEGVFSKSAQGGNLAKEFFSKIAIEASTIAIENAELLAKKAKHPVDFGKELALLLDPSLKSLKVPWVSFLNTQEDSQKRDIELLAKVCDSGGGISSATLYLRGSPIDIEEASRGISFQRKNEEVCNVYSRVLSLEDGVNDIVLVANNQFGGESIPATIKISYEDTFENKKELHIVTLAVSEYKNQAYSLRYPVKDAQAIQSTLSAAAYGYFKNVISHIKHDQEVTVEQVEDLFYNLKGTIRSDDVLVVFIAGHGIFSKKSSEYYFLPYDFDSQDLDTVAKTSISSSQLQMLLSSVNAAQTLVLIDTCQSGGFDGLSDVSENLSPDQLNFVHRLGRASLMASTKEQVAFEGYNGHGAFTYIVLDAIEGRGDYTNDGYLSVDELSTYVSLHLPKLTEKVWGFRQEATRNVTGHNFVIGQTIRPNVDLPSIY